MRRKLTIQEIEKRIFEINKNLKVLSKEYFGTKHKLDIKCMKCGYEHKISWNTLSATKKDGGCPSCSNRIKMKTIEEAQLRCDKLNLNITLVEDKYKNTSTKLKYRCNKCGCIGQSTITQLQARKGCPYCETHNKKMTTDDAGYKINNFNKNVELVTNNFKGHQKPIVLRCKKCKLEWESTFFNFRVTPECPNCGNAKSRLDVDMLKQIIKIRKLNIELMSDKYNGSQFKNTFKCNACNNIWETTWSTISSGSGCPVCAREKMRNGNKYNIKVAERKKEEWINKHGILYLINCCNEHEDFYKIGITSRSVKLRYGSGDSMPYSYKIVKQWRMSLYDCVIVEDIIENYGFEKYCPNIKFGGYTESYVDKNINEIESIINKHKDTN